MAELVSIKRNVDVSPGQAAPAVFHCSQGDVGSKIILGLLNNGTAYSIPSGVTVTIEGSESNGSIFTPISATASGSDITFYLTGEMTAVAGPAICQAVLKSGSNILGTANFTLEVESSPMGADAPPVFTDAGWTWMLNKLNTEFVPALGNETIIDAIDGKADQSDLTALSNTVAGHTGSITVLNNTVNNLNHDVTENRQNIATKLDKNQGTANAGKYLKVGADGDVEAEDLDVTTDKTLSVADKAADAKAVGDELDVLKADLNQQVSIIKDVLNDGLVYPENTNFADRIESPMQVFQFTDAKIGITKFSGVVPYNGKFIASSGSDTYGFYNPFYGFTFEIASTNGGVYSVESKPSGDASETLDGISEITGTEDGYFKRYVVNLPKEAYIIFAYRKVDSSIIKTTINNHYTAQGMEFNEVQDNFLRYSKREANTSEGISIIKLENKLVNTTNGAMSTNESYDTYYFTSQVSALNVTCKNGFRAVITAKDPTTITSNGYLTSVVYANSSARVETFSLGLGQYAVISVAHTAGDINLVTDYVKTFTLPTLRLSYQQKNGFYRLAKSGNATYLYIYMVSGEKVVQWELHNVPATASNSNTWQIGHVMGYDYDGQSLSNGVELVSGGEFELAFKEYGAADYCGGNNHGDENTIDFMLMIDGKTVDLANIDEDYHMFDRIDAIEHAYVNRCDTPAENILKHQKIWTFENGTVKVRQTLKFLESLECDFLCCMLAANRSAFTHGVRQGRVGIEDMSTATYDKVYTRGNEMMYLMYGTNATAKVTARTANHTPECTLWINNAASLNKLYYNYFGQMPKTSVASGTVLEWEQEYDIAYN